MLGLQSTHCNDVLSPSLTVWYVLCREKLKALREGLLNFRLSLKDEEKLARLRKKAHLQAMGW